MLLGLLASVSPSNICLELLYSNHETAPGIFEDLLNLASAESIQQHLDRGFEAVLSSPMGCPVRSVFNAQTCAQMGVRETESDEQAAFCFSAYQYLIDLCLVNREITATKACLVSYVMACFAKVQTLC
jgi:hypothetical protein